MTSYSNVTYTKDLVSKPGDNSIACFALPQAARTAGAVKIEMLRKEIWLSSHEKSGVIVEKVYILSLM